MRKLIAAAMITLLGFSAHAAEPSLERYVDQFDYEARKEMKIDSAGLIQLLKEGKAELIDIRFPEEYAAWRVDPSTNIPLNELPKRLGEIDTSKVVVTACPHKDRATIAMVYLRAQGIEAKYLTDGLLGLMENLRGDAAREFVESLKQSDERE